MSPPVNAIAHPRRDLCRPIRVDDTTHVGEARRLAASLCRDLDFGAPRIGQAALIVTELATNLFRHTAGAGGELVFRAIEEAGATGMDILSLDRGPGIANIGESLRDGCSTANSSGTGLGAIRRASSVFDVFSALGKGTVLFSRLWKGSPPALPPDAPPALCVGAVCVPARGEQACGDAWSMQAGGQAQGTTTFMLADGLGHGPDAAAAADLAVAIFKRHALKSPAELVSLIHAGLKGTRGAAVAVAELPGAPPAARVVRFAGVGNIAGLMLCGKSWKNLSSFPGTAGLEARKIQEFCYPWPEGGMLVLHSDGISGRWSLDDYPGLAHKHPALIAGVLFRDHQRPRDDSTVLVAMESGRRDGP